MREVKPHQCKNNLSYLYLEQEFSMKDIADKYGVGVNTVRHFMYKHGIPIRRGSEKVTKRKREYYSKIRKGRPTWNKGLKGNYQSWTKHGESAPGYKGGISEKGSRGGYRKILSPSHPNADANGYVFEHRLVCEKLLGRYLTDEEIVHHRDGDPLNNSPSNLFIFYGHGTHRAFHAAKLRDSALTEEQFCRGEDNLY